MYVNINYNNEEAGEKIFVGPVRCTLTEFFIIGDTGMGEIGKILLQSEKSMYVENRMRVLKNLIRNVLSDKEVENIPSSLWW